MYCLWIGVYVTVRFQSVCVRTNYIQAQNPRVLLGSGHWPPRFSSRRSHCTASASRLKFSIASDFPPLWRKRLRLQGNINAKNPVGETMWSTYLASKRPFPASAIFYVDKSDLSFPLGKAHVKGCNNDGSGITCCSEMGGRGELYRGVQGMINACFQGIGTTGGG